MWGQREQHRAAGGTGGRSPEPGTTVEGLDPATASRHTMALRRADACRTRGAAGTCAAAQATLCKATAGHRQLVLQLGGSADGPRLREERRRMSAEARELSSGKEGAAAPRNGCGAPPAPTPVPVEESRVTPAQRPHPAGLRCALLAGLRQAPGSPEERRELERLWVLFLSVLELFLQDLCRAHHLCQLFSLQGDGTAPLRTGLGNRRGGAPLQPLAAPCLEEEIEQVRATLAEMESRANIPLWTVEATQSAGTGTTTAVSSQGGPPAGPCCRVL